MALHGRYWPRLLGAQKSHAVHTASQSHLGAGRRGCPKERKKCHQNDTEGPLLVPLRHGSDTGLMEALQMSITLCGKQLGNMFQSHKNVHMYLNQESNPRELTEEKSIQRKKLQTYVHIYIRTIYKKIWR